MTAKLAKQQTTTENVPAAATRSGDGPVTIPAVMPDEMYSIALEPDEGSGGISPRTIFGSDNRRQPNPYIWGVAFLTTYWKNGKSTYGTAFVIADKAFLTAAHNVYSFSMGGWCDHVTLEPSRKVNSRPFNTISSTAIHTSTAWIDSGQSGNINYDYAVVEVGSNIGQQTGLFGFTSNSYKGLSITINGYPDDKMGDYGITQWLHTGTLTTIYDNTVETNNTDAAKGQSGGPFYNNNDEAVAIMTGQNASNNIGTRITGQLVNWLSTFR